MDEKDVGHRYQLKFTVKSKPFLLRTTQKKLDALRIVAASRRVSMNKLLNDLIDEVIRKEVV